MPQELGMNQLRELVQQSNWALHNQKVPASPKHPNSILVDIGLLSLIKVNPNLKMKVSVWCFISPM
jgi:hypothetical protein